jgi:hypothetical protein
LRYAENAVTVRAAQVGKDHQPRDLFGIRRRQANRGESPRDEGFEDA